MSEGIAAATVIGGDFVVQREAASLGTRRAGRFYEVEQRSTSQRRTLRVLEDLGPADPKVVAEEAKVASKIRSEHVAEVIATGVDASLGEGTAWIVTELLEGEDLAARIARGPMGPSDVRQLLLQLSHGVGAAHAVGILHGELRPESVLVCASHRADVGSTVKVLDFGIAKRLREQLTVVDGVEAPLWSAPEQLEFGSKTTPAVDVHAMGLLAFAMLTGKSYWKGASADEILSPEILAEVVSETRPAASSRAELLGVGHLIPPGFDGWFQRAIARDPASRFASASAAFKELDPVLVNAAAMAPPSDIALLPTQQLSIPTGPATPAAPPPQGGIGQTLVGAPLDLPPSLAQFANPAPQARSAAAAPIGATQVGGIGATQIGPMAGPPGYDAQTSHPAPPPYGAPPPYAGPPPYAAPPPHQGPPMQPAPTRGLKRSHALAIAAGGMAIVGLGIFGIVMATSKPDKPKRSWDDDDDDRRSRRRGSSETDEGGPPVAVARAYQPVKLDLHVMSKCPYGIQVENTLDGVRKSLGDAVDVNIEFIGSERDGELQSLHGPTEVQGDKFQICAEKYTSKWYDVLVCQNKQTANIDKNWDSCAIEAGVPGKEISAVDLCAAGQEGKDLLSASFAKSKTAKASGSPTIFINGEQFQGGRTASAFTTKICSAFPAGAARPSACDNIKPPPVVDVQILSDARCSDCKPEKLKTQVSARFSGAKITMVDYADPAGATLWSLIKPSKLPAIILDAAQADADPDGVSLVKAAKKVGSSYVISAGADWNPECADPGGCALAACSGTLACRPETPGTLDLYIMSRCPFASKGLIALKEVMKNFTDHGATLAVNVHYIGEDKAGVLTSMHGKDEVDDDLRDVCVAKYYPRTYLNYLYCRAEDVKKPWEDCTGPATGFDQGTIAACTSSAADGQVLLSKSFGETDTVGIRSSPTWITNGKYKFSGIDAETIKDAICAHNALPGCSVTLSGPPSKSSSGSKPALPAAPAPTGCTTP